VKRTQVRWSRDADGLWLELPGAVRGFDIDSEKNDDGRLVYRLSERGGHGRWEKLAFLRGGEEKLASGESAKKKGVRVRAQMPGKIIRVLVAAGATVEKDQSLAVMEAMKMENEIRAPQAGRLSQAKAVEGQAVETGADLFVIEPL
jgi:acetyl/propionyl-CoA carboxylase alpha subunit